MPISEPDIIVSNIPSRGALAAPAAIGSAIPSS
jgi:hypothetical protein